MELVVCKDGGRLVNAVTEWCEAEIQRWNAKAMYLPAGQTPRPLYDHWSKVRPRFIDRVKLVQIDDVITGSHRGQFRRFFLETLAPYKSNFEWFEMGGTLAEIGILGLGLNGHVAFHEPDIDLNFFSGCLPLSPDTCQRLGLETGTWGGSYGVAAFMKCKSLSMIVTGESKRKILSEMLSANKKVPASALLQHPRLTLFTDPDAMP